MSALEARQQSAAGTDGTGTLRLIRLAGLVATAALVFGIVPEVLGSLWLKVLISAAIYGLAASGVALLYARLGLVSLMQVALVGVGGWVTLKMWHATGLPFEIDMLAGGLAAAIVGALLGLPALRMRGLYFALVTLMAAAAFQIFITATQFPNGGEGWLGVSRSAPAFMPRPLLATTDAAMFRYVVAVAVLCFLAIEACRRSRAGRAWALIRKSEASAMAAGVSVAFYKLAAFALAGFVAGVAGGLLAATIGVLDARSFPAADSVMLFALTLVGGAYAFLGQAITGLLFRAVPALLNDVGVDGDIAFLIFGAALLHALITAPTGIAGQLFGLFGRLIRLGGRR
ncbi:branched-chain amino acid ABC transporter permease [Jiella endophytica]|uniref:Branched-chain amino acid ABC transporter permease n=1 Tax=Jiella endophytica TaxID=2558362 RepID=A0A4Y8R7T4_9HYPH|nr:branched-chain amino acid ABC transporter permease [Jiella endophytica]TFF17681.1 branched-chain amino acid ABC transporter permease [Jiella endophytica]